MREKKVWVKRFGSKRCRVKKKIELKNIWVKKNLGKKIGSKFLDKKLGLEKFWLKKVLVEKNFGQKNLWLKKFFS